MGWADKRSPSAAERVCVLVLGGHRVGSSALARVLGYLGCDLPRRPLRGDADNETGYWEPLSILRLDQRILASAGSTWLDVRAIDPRRLRTPQSEPFRREAVEALAEEFGDSRLFALKEPRICRILPFWLEALETAGVRPLVVSIVRHPLEAAASLHGRDGFDPSLGCRLWLHNALEAEFASRGLPRFFTSYDSLLADWRRFAERSRSALGIAWPRRTDEIAEAVEAFLSERYRHHRAASVSVAGSPALQGWLRESYAVLDGWAREGEHAEGRAALDRIRRAFNAAAPAFPEAPKSPRR
jgi:hypothetical protein